jgi:general secretion pathway protein C
MRISTPSFLRKRPDVNLGLRALTGLIGALLCWQIAGLFSQILGWQTIQPALVKAQSAAIDSSAGRAALARWFTSAETSSKPASSASKLKLIAVVSGPRGVALLGGIESTPIAVAVGEDAQPGLRLVEVLADRVVFEQAGARSELAFPTSAADLISPAGQTLSQPQAAPAPKSTEANTPSPAQQQHAVSRGQIAGVAQRGNLGDWDKGLASFAGGGIRVASVNAQPLAKALKLRDGDILKRVNGQDLKQLADISLIYHHFSQSPELNLTVLRDGKPMQLTFKIQP